MATSSVRLMTNLLEELANEDLSEFYAEIDPETGNDGLEDVVADIFRLPFLIDDERGSHGL